MGHPLRAYLDFRAGRGRPALHINMCALRCPFTLSIYDSRWEANESLELDRNQNVRAWVKKRPRWF